MPFVKKSNWSVEEIKTHIESGKTMAEIAVIYGLSRQRIKQICQRHKLPNTIQTRGKQRTATYFSKWGVKADTDLYRVCRDKFRTKKATAKRLGVPWNLDFGELIWPETCPVLKIPLDYFAEKTQENSPSFDRTDPLKGYIPGNVRVISWRANRIKNDGSANEHRLIAAYLDHLTDVV